MDVVSNSSFIFSQNVIYIKSPYIQYLKPFFGEEEIIKQSLNFLSRKPSIFFLRWIDHEYLWAFVIAVLGAKN